MKRSENASREAEEKQSGVVTSRTLTQRISDELARPVPNVLLLQRLRSMRASTNRTQSPDQPAIVSMMA